MAKVVRAFWLDTTTVKEMAAQKKISSAKMHTLYNNIHYIHAYGHIPVIRTRLFSPTPRYLYRTSRYFELKAFWIFPSLIYYRLFRTLAISNYFFVSLESSKKRAPTVYNGKIKQQSKTWPCFREGLYGLHNMTKPKELKSLLLILG